MSHHYRARSRVLIVDDDPFMRTVLSELVRTCGAAPSLAENGQQALDRLTRQHFQLILMDIRMPVLDGISALTRLRLNADPTPVIMISANADADTSQRLLAGGANAVIRKPFSTEEVRATVERLLAA